MPQGKIDSPAQPALHNMSKLELTGIYNRIDPDRPFACLTTSIQQTPHSLFDLHSYRPTTSDPNIIPSPSIYLHLPLINLVTPIERRLYIESQYLGAELRFTPQTNTSSPRTFSMGITFYTF